MGRCWPTVFGGSVSGASSPPPPPPPIVGIKMQFIPVLLKLYPDKLRSQNTRKGNLRAWLKITRISKHSALIGRTPASTNERSVPLRRSAPLLRTTTSCPCSSDHIWSTTVRAYSRTQQSRVSRILSASSDLSANSGRKEVRWIVQKRVRCGQFAHFHWQPPLWQIEPFLALSHPSSGLANMVLSERQDSITSFSCHGPVLFGEQRPNRNKSVLLPGNRGFLMHVHNSQTDITNNILLTVFREVYNLLFSL